jgi:hypothetical protein
MNDMNDIADFFKDEAHCEPHDNNTGTKATLQIIQTGEELMNTFTSLQNVTVNDPSGNTVKPATGFHSGVDAGVYICKIDSATLKQHPAKGHDILRIALTIQSGPDTGHRLNKAYHLTTKSAREFIVREMAGIGFTLDNRQALLDLPSKLLGTIVSADIQDHSTGNQVTYLRGVTQPKKAPLLDPDSIWV